MAKRLGLRLRDRLRNFDQCPMAMLVMESPESHLMRPKSEKRVRKELRM